jgi:hypothetical protein
MRSPRIVSLAALIGLASCEPSDAPVRANVIADLILPSGVLDAAEQLEMRVLDGGKCDESTGVVDEAGAKELLKKGLGAVGCAAGAVFCGDLTVEKSATPRVFAAKATGAGGAVLAVGCTTKAVEQDMLALAIKMYRYLAPAVCGDGVLQPTEQCEPGGSDVCDDRCQAKEILLSAGASSNDTSNGKAGDKSDAFFLWPEGGGETGRFFALYTDRAVPSGNVEVGLRVLNADLSKPADPPALAAGSILLPNGGAFPPAPAPGVQSLPQAARLGSKYYVVFQDDVTPASGGIDIHLRAINGALQSDQADTPLYVNGSAGESGTQAAPAISANAQRLLIVWQDQTNGSIAGRTLTPYATLGDQNEISTGSGNTRPMLAQVGKGWVVVWNSDTGIKRRVIGDDGVPSSPEDVVSESGGGADGAHIAALPDGRYAVVWSKNSDIFVQRYDASGNKIAGDQGNPINDVVKVGTQSQPAIGATPGAGGSYVVAWHDESSGHIRARALGGSSGFLYNHVNGRSSEFQASIDDGRTRAAPVVAVGGSGPFVAIGWEDESASGAGIVVRRFPLPE